MHIANGDSWTCPRCHESVGRQHNESAPGWDARRRQIQLQHGTAHPTPGGTR